jgi:hypothetical protein
VVTQHVHMSYGAIEGTLIKRHDKTPRYFEFFFGTGTVSIRMSKKSPDTTKTILAETIKDVKMIYDNQEDRGRAFSVTVPGSVFHLASYTAKEAECWVRVFRIVRDMNSQRVSLADKNPFVFEKEQVIQSLNKASSRYSRAHVP